jgi:hypothetical protein
MQKVVVVGPLPLSLAQDPGGCFGVHKVA